MKVCYSGNLLVMGKPFLIIHSNRLAQESSRWNSLVIFLVSKAVHCGMWKLLKGIKVVGTMLPTCSCFLLKCLFIVLTLM
jgi:hypothetical protein